MVSTRHTQFGSNSTIEEFINCASGFNLSERRQRWANLLSENNHQPLIEEVLKRELPKYSTRSRVLPSTYSTIVRECTLVLASASPVLEAAVDGTLVQSHSVDPELQEAYSKIQQRARVQPSIYIHLLADENGIAPSLTHYDTVQQAVLDYLTTESRYDDMAWSIDNVSAPKISHSLTSAGYRKYLWTNHHRSQQHVDTLLRFCRGVEKRVAETPRRLRDIPMAHPPSECGYSINSHVRLAQHRNRQSSNYVMNLVEDVCTHLYMTGVLKQKFSLHQFIIFLIFRPAQAAIAEIFCSGLLQVWVDEGGGLNAHPAGLSVASAKKVTKEQWLAHERWVIEHTDLTRNLKIQRERLEEDALSMEKEVEDAWRRALNSESEDDDDDPRDGDYEPESLAEGLCSLRIDRYV